MKFSQPGDTTSTKKKEKESRRNRERKKREEKGGDFSAKSRGSATVSEDDQTVEKSSTELKRVIEKRSTGLCHEQKTDRTANSPDKGLKI